MINRFPQVTTKAFCLACKGCCRFDSEQSIWRPKVATCEQIFVDLRENLDEDHYVKADSTEHCIKCRFLNLENNHCSVYLMRPAECVMYPFLLLHKGSSVVLGVHLSCPYVQEEMHNPSFQEKIKDVKEFCLDGGFLSYVEENPEMVSDYSQYMNEIKILFEVI